MDCSPPGSPVHGILQARTLDWTAIPFSREFFLIQGANPGLLHCRQILHCLSHQDLPGFMNANFKTFREGGQRDSGPELQGGALPGMRGGLPPGSLVTPQVLLQAQSAQPCRAEEWLCAHCVPTSQPDAGREESQGAGSEELLRPPTFYAGQTGTSLARTLRSPYTSQYSVQFSRSVVSDSLRPHEWQHARPPCPSPSPGVHSDSRPSSP